MNARMLTLYSLFLGQDRSAHSMGDRPVLAVAAVFLHLLLLGASLPGNFIVLAVRLRLFFSGMVAGNTDIVAAILWCICVLGLWYGWRWAWWLAFVLDGIAILLGVARLGGFLFGGICYLAGIAFAPMDGPGPAMALSAVAYALLLHEDVRHHYAVDRIAAQSPFLGTIVLGARNGVLFWGAGIERALVHLCICAARTACFCARAIRGAVAAWELGRAGYRIQNQGIPNQTLPNQTVPNQAMVAARDSMAGSIVSTRGKTKLGRAAAIADKIIICLVVGIQNLLFFLLFVYALLVFPWTIACIVLAPWISLAVVAFVIWGFWSGLRSFSGRLRPRLALACWYGLPACCAVPYLGRLEHGANLAAFYVVQVFLYLAATAIGQFVTPFAAAQSKT